MAMDAHGGIKAGAYFATKTLSSKKKLFGCVMQKNQLQKLLKRFEYLLAVQTQQVQRHEAEEERVDIVHTTASRSESSESGQRLLGRLRQLHTAGLEDIIEMAQNVRSPGAHLEEQAESGYNCVEEIEEAGQTILQKRIQNRRGEKRWISVCRNTAMKSWTLHRSYHENARAGEEIVETVQERKHARIGEEAVDLPAPQRNNSSISLCQAPWYRTSGRRRGSESVPP